MKKIIGLILGFLIISCTPKVIVTDPDKGEIMKRTMNGKYSIEQFDSMCVADTLPRDLSDWKITYLVDYETNEHIALYLYMKESGKTESVYKVEKIPNDSVKIIKRVIIE